MIGAIEGKIKQIMDDSVLLETKAGVSFWIRLPSNLLKKLTSDKTVKVITHLYVSENDLSLYGFENFNQYQWFKLLLTVNSVGPKNAFSIISFSSIELIKEAITKKDVEFFSQIRGIGKKTAARIILDLSSKIDKDVSLNFINLSADDQLLVEGLKQLGFENNKIRKIITKVPANKSVEDRLKFALKLLANDK